MIPALEVRNLTKLFGRERAVDRLDLRVAPGEIYGFLGRNGAGKTTTIRMLLGMIRPTEGWVEILGRRVRGDQGPWNRVGSLVEGAAAWPDLTVRDNLRTLAHLHGLREARVVDQGLQRLQLENLADKKARQLSLGNLQRLALAMALLPDPDLLLLDEPINGLDPGGVVEIRELLISMARQRGTTILVSSHALDEVARTCTRIGILHHGRLIEERSGDEWGQLTSRRLTVGTPDIDKARAALLARGIVCHPGPRPQTLDLGDTPPETIAPILVAAGARLSELTVAVEGLEELFLRITEDSHENA